jgi:hypothetical protein
MASDKENECPNRILLKGQINYKDWSNPIKVKLEAESLDTVTWKCSKDNDSLESDKDSIKLKKKDTKEVERKERQKNREEDSKNKTEGLQQSTRVYRSFNSESLQALCLWRTRHTMANTRE